MTLWNHFKSINWLIQTQRSSLRKAYYNRMPEFMSYVYQSSNTDAQSVISPNPCFAAWVWDHPFCLSAGSSKHHWEKFDTGSSWSKYSDLFDLFNRLSFCEDEWWDRCATAQEKKIKKWSDNYKGSYIIKASRIQEFIHTNTGITSLRISLMNVGHLNMLIHYVL